MKNILRIILCLALFYSCKTEKNKNMAIATVTTYPETKKVDTVDNYFGKEVPDPYRWLEDDRSKETEDWVKSENAVTFNYLKNIPYREELKERLTELWNYEKVGAPFVEGDYTYFYKNVQIHEKLSNHLRNSALAYLMNHRPYTY